MNNDLTGIEDAVIENLVLRIMNGVMKKHIGNVNTIEQAKKVTEEIAQEVTKEILQKMEIAIAKVMFKLNEAVMKNPLNDEKIN
jgi:hypothetical protein